MQWLILYYRNGRVLLSPISTRKRATASFNEFGYAGVYLYKQSYPQARGQTEATPVAD